MTLHREWLRRILALALITTGLASIGFLGVWVGMGLVAAGFVAYALLPWPERPEKAFGFEHGPAVIGPDVLGLLLCGFFFALPFWAAATEGDSPWAHGLLVHPSAILVWPMGLVSLLILRVGARNAGFWLKIEEDALHLHRNASLQRRIPYSSIQRTSPYRKGLPKWMRLLTPLLVATGRYGAAGAILVARDSTGIELHLEDGSTEVIEQDGFEQPYRALLETLESHDIVTKDDVRNRTR